MPNKLRHDHEATIAHINSELQEHFVVSLYDVNRAAGSKVVTPSTIRDASNPSSAHIAERIKKGELARLRITTLKGPRSFLVKSRFKDAVAMANMGNRRGGGLPPLVTALRSIARQGAHKEVRLQKPSKSKGVAFLLEKGFLEEMRPSAPSQSYAIYRIRKKPEFDKLLRTVKRAVELQGVEAGWE